ncbi:hypothetical protein Aperf_G00000035935 [Anoplocephala perfoliata]
MDPLLMNKVAMVTGASSGIGRAVSVLFAELGSKVALIGRNEAKLQQTYSLCVNACKFHNASDFLIVKADLGQVDQIPEALDRVINHFGKLDILVNNAGIVVEDKLETFNVEAYTKLMNINLLAVIRLTQLATPKLVESKGCVINVSSVCGRAVRPHLMTYSVGKAALDMVTKFSAQELGPKGVRVNAVAPALIATDIYINAGTDEEEMEKKFKFARETYPLHRSGTPEEVAQAIAYLASSKGASFITGAILDVDGGYLCT